MNVSLISAPVEVGKENMERWGGHSSPSEGQAATIPIMAGLFLALTVFLVMVLAQAEPNSERGDAALASLASAAASVWVTPRRTIVPPESQADRRQAALRGTLTAFGDLEDGTFGFGIRLREAEIFIDASPAFRPGAREVIASVTGALISQVPPHVRVVIVAGRSEGLMEQGAALLSQMIEAGFSAERLVLSQDNAARGLALRFRDDPFDDPFYGARQ